MHLERPWREINRALGIRAATVLLAEEDHADARNRIPAIAALAGSLRDAPMSVRGTIRVGIGGWVFAPWRGTFYPKGVKQADELGYASRQVT